MHAISHLEIFYRVMFALLCGCLLGIERERSEHSAGIRTHSLVAVSSCLLMIVSAFGFNDAIAAGNVMLDPSRVAAQVVSGIGFLGAGVIMLRQNTIKWSQYSGEHLVCCGNWFVLWWQIILCGGSCNSRDSCRANFLAQI